MIPFSIAEPQDIPQPGDAPTPEPGGNEQGEEDEQDIDNYVEYGCIMTQLKPDAQLDENFTFTKAIVVNRNEYVCVIRKTITNILELVTSLGVAVRVPDREGLPHLLQEHRGEIFFDASLGFTCGVGNEAITIPLYRIEPGKRLEPFVRKRAMYETNQGWGSRLKQFSCEEFNNIHDANQNNVVDALEYLKSLSELIKIIEESRNGGNTKRE